MSGKQVWGPDDRVLPFWQGLVLLVLWTTALFWMPLLLLFTWIS